MLARTTPVRKIRRKTTKPMLSRDLKDLYRIIELDEDLERIKEMDEAEEVEASSSRISKAS